VKIIPTRIPTVAPQWHTVKNKLFGSINLQIVAVLVEQEFKSASYADAKHYKVAG